MPKPFDFFKKHTFWFLILLVSIPSFSRMLRTGMYTTQDFHFFRLVEFDKCTRDLQLPCRWAPDAGLGYGEPLFNFYGQLSYAIGEIFHLSGISHIDSLKLLFILSLLGSAISMFVLAKSIWRSDAGSLLSAVLYVYAPYRAVDVWVRGALPEALAFILFPLILWKADSFIEKEKKADLFWLTTLLAALVLTHNLSFILFLPVLLVWVPYKLYRKGKWSLLLKLGGAAVGAALLSAFYILPVLFEAKHIALETTIRGYFDFRGHFATLEQLLFSRFWGYGASVFGPEDDLSLAIGRVHWILPLLIAVMGLKTRFKHYKELLALIALGWFSLFLAHNRSTPLWEALPFMAYIQFPWRFLSTAVFSFSLAAGALPLVLPRLKTTAILGIALVVVFLNYPFFREDIWQEITDADLRRGHEWERQMRASIGDFWPNFGPIPTEPAPQNPENGQLLEKRSSFAKYRVAGGREVEFPTAYFPGWVGSLDNQSLDVYPSDRGLIAARVPGGEWVVSLEFTDTPVRALGNLVSLVSILAALGIYRRIKSEN